ncbi:MAG: molybdopterin-dependent oxidoreductase [Actinomycetota bacterium]|nr:molybdopterin-dependent oxidoreductase [Actinomycetota bacterium]
MGVVRSFCRICIANCGILVQTDGDRVLEVRGDPEHPLSKGYVCPKGRALGVSHHSPRRLAASLVRSGGVLAPADAADALADAGAALARVVAQHGPEAVGMFMGSGGFIDPAGTYAFHRLKAALGTKQTYSTASVDSVAKTYVTALMGGTTALVPHPDEQGTLLVFVGSNPVVSHGQSTMYANPIERIRAARARGEVYVIDPRLTETARLADRHLPARPGTDHAVLAYLVRGVLADGVDVAALAATAAGVEALRAAAEPFDLAHTSAVTGVPAADLQALAASVRRAGRLAVVTGTGTTMSPAGNLVEWFAWALMILTGSFDQPGGMWFNPGYMSRVDRRDRLPTARLGEPGAPSRPDIERLMGEWPASLIPEEILSGRMKALVVFGANAVTGLPDTDRVVEALRALDVLVVLEVDRTETAELATHVIACRDQLERPDVLPLGMFAGQVYDQYTPAVVPAAPGRVPAWRALATVGTALGHEVLGAGADIAALDCDDVLRMSTRGGVDALREVDGAAVEAPAIYGWVEPRLPHGVWDLAPAPLVGQLRDFTAAPPAAGLLLTPRRQLRHQNSQPYREGDHPLALLHPTDAAALGITDGDAVELTSAIGGLQAVASVTDGNVAGSVSVPHGWAATNVNRLIGNTVLDPLTGMPHMSGTRVQVRSLAGALAAVPAGSEGTTHD